MVHLLLSLIVCAPLVGAVWLLVVAGRGVCARTPEAVNLAAAALVFCVKRRAPLVIARDLERLRLGLRRRICHACSPRMLMVFAAILALGIHLGQTEHTLFAHSMAWLTVITGPGLLLLLGLASLMVDRIAPQYPVSLGVRHLPPPVAVPVTLPLAVPLQPPRSLSSVAA